MTQKADIDAAAEFWRDMRDGEFIATKLNGGPGKNGDNGIAGAHGRRADDRNGWIATDDSGALYWASSKVDDRRCQRKLS